MITNDIVSLISILHPSLFICSKMLYIKIMLDFIFFFFLRIIEI
jgi:hypothetical protein